MPTRNTDKKRTSDADAAWRKDTFKLRSNADVNRWVVTHKKAPFDWYGLEQVWESGDGHRINEVVGVNMGDGTYAAAFVNGIRHRTNGERHDYWLSCWWLYSKAQALAVGMQEDGWPESLPVTKGNKECLVISSHMFIVGEESIGKSTQRDLVRDLQRADGSNPGTAWLRDGALVFPKHSSPVIIPSDDLNEMKKYFIGQPL